MNRGDIVTVSYKGDYGKPRPALIIQSDLFQETGSVTVLPMTSHVMDSPLLRAEIIPDPKNGLQKLSQVMIDKIITVAREKVGKTVGVVSPSFLVEIDRLLALFLGIA